MLFRSLLTFGRDRFARLLDATTGTPLVPPLEHLSLVQSAVFSPDNALFATVTTGDRAHIWSADTGEPVSPPFDHTMGSGPVEFSADGRFLFTMHPARAVYVWDLSRTNEPPVLLRPGSPGALAESGQDGSVFVTRDPNSPIRVRALSGAAEVSLHPSSLKMTPIQAWFDNTGQFVILEYPKQRAQIWHAATGLPVTPCFQSRYTTNETNYRTVLLPAFSLAPIGGEGRGEEAISKSEIRNPKSEMPPLTSGLRPLTSDSLHRASVVSPPPSVLRLLAELLSGSRLDGTGGWKPLELGEIVERWKRLNERHRAALPHPSDTLTARNAP